MVVFEFVSWIAKVCDSQSVNSLCYSILLYCSW